MNMLLRSLDALTFALFVVGCACFGIMTLGYGYEVMSRYFFGSPTSWASDFGSYLLCAGTFLTLPQLTRESGNVALTFIDDFAAAAKVRRVAIARDIVSGAVCLFAVWICYGALTGQIEGGARTIATISIPKWALTSLVVAGLGLAALHFLRHAYAKRSAP
jgi:C4-dicarboxylate transporter DctQ subunit